jgi:hypothetical protein
LDICKGCEHYTAIGSCGPLGRKTKVKEEIKGRKGEFELCGCVMSIKCKVKFARCPIMKWSPTEATKEEMNFFRDASRFTKKMNGKNSLSSNEIQELYKFHNHTHGSKRKSSGCAPCVKSAMEDLTKWVNEIK